MDCKCFWQEDGKCWQDEPGPQETCTSHAHRIDAMTGKPMGPVEGPENADQQKED